MLSVSLNKTFPSFMVVCSRIRADGYLVDVSERVVSVGIVYVVCAIIRVK